MTEITENTVIGLKQNVKRFVSKSNELQQRLDTSLNVLTTTLILLKPDSSTIWSLVEPLGLVKYVKDTGKCNVYTTISDYTNKGGKTTKAHHTYYGKYYGTLKSYGNDPVSYSGYLPVTPQYFKYKPNDRAETVMDLFVELN